MKKLLIILLAGLLISPAMAQSLERELFGSAGTAVKAGSAEMSYSIGELVTLSTIVPYAKFTQGFQQAEDEDLVGIIDLTIHDIQTLVFPNPTVDKLEVRSTLAERGISTLDYEVLDAHGRVVLTGTIASNEGQIDVSTLASSTYTLRLTNKNGAFSHTERFSKITL